MRFTYMWLLWLLWLLWYVIQIYVDVEGDELSSKALCWAAQGDATFVQACNLPWVHDMGMYDAQWCCVKCKLDF